MKYDFKQISTTSSGIKWSAIEIYLKNIFLWHSTFWQNPVMITEAKRFEKSKLSGQLIETLHEVQTIANSGVSHICILNISGGIHFRK